MLQKPRKFQQEMEEEEEIQNLLHISRSNQLKLLVAVKFQEFHVLSLWRHSGRNFSIAIHSKQLYPNFEIRF